MSIKSVICWIFGLSMFFLPTITMGIMGITLTPGGAIVTRLFGASFIVLALWLGLARESEDHVAMRAVTVAVAAGDLLGAAVMVYGLLTGVGNVLGWLIVILYLLLAIGFGYFLFVEPEGKLAT